jgi:glycosyltransferase involved in cell wall biosynthesis
MRILLINHYAGSEQMGMEYRPFYLAREWASAGHDPTIIAANFSHLRNRQPKICSDLEATEEDGVRFRWLQTSQYSGNGMGRVINMAAFTGKLHLNANRLAREQRPDVVICSSTYPLDIHAGMRIARNAGAKLVFEVHDLWPLTPMLLGGYSPRHPFIRVLQHAEDLAYRTADVVVSILPHALDHMVQRGLNATKFVYIPNGVSVRSACDSAALPVELDRLIAAERARGRFLIGYAGGLTLSMAVETMLQAAHLLTDMPVTMVIVGDGPEAGALRGQAAAMGLENVHLPGRISKDAVPVFLARMDALAIPWRRSPLYRYGVSPNKIFDYMLAARPILQACDASNDLVAEANCGLTSPPEDPPAFAHAVLRLQKLPKCERQRLGENGRQFVVQHHNYHVLARRFLDAIFEGGNESHDGPLKECQENIHWPAQQITN